MINLILFRSEGETCFAELKGKNPSWKPYFAFSILIFCTFLLIQLQLDSHQISLDNNKFFYIFIYYRLSGNWSYWAKHLHREKVPRKHIKNTLLRVRIHNMLKYNLASIQVGQLIMYYTPKKVLPFAFFLIYQAFKNREGIISQKILAECWRSMYFGFTK